MILIDSLYINNSGGKVLLDYLIQSIEKENLKVHYIIDDRIKDNHPIILNNKVTYLKASLLNRHRFYSKHKSEYSKVLCFGNLPPTIRLKVPVFTYFHQLLFLDIPDSVSFLNKIKIALKIYVLSILKSNTTRWLVQSKVVKERLAYKYKVNLDIIYINPFYPPLKNSADNLTRRKDGFVYISNGGMHKNHVNLIDSFCAFFDEGKKGILHLTISDQFPELIKIIKDKIILGYPITNHGFINREQLIKIYQTNEYLIFPSLAESFGLTIIEAIENGCKVIGSDLPYIYAVCNPSIVFNPLDRDDIVRALHYSQSNEIKKTEQLTFNQIEELISLLKSS